MRLSTVLFRIQDVNLAEFGWPCGDTFISNRSRCWTDPKTGKRLKKPIPYKVYQKIQESDSKAAKTLYKDREQKIRDKRKASVPGWKKKEVAKIEVPTPGTRSQEVITSNPLPDKQKPITLGEFDDYYKALQQGNVTPEHIKVNWQRVKDGRQQITNELNKLTKEDLTKRISGYVSSNAKKSELVNKAYQTITQSFAPSTLKYNPLVDGSRESAIEKAITEWDQELINEKAKRRQQILEDHRSKIERVKTAIENPQTLEDFDLKQKYDKQSLTEKQQKQYEELLAERKITDRRLEDEQKGKIQAIRHDGIKMTVRQTKHTKTGQDLHVASLDQRVDRDTYNQLNQRAKKLGGYYSSYAKDGAIPGFQFKDPDKAKEFISLDEINKGADNIKNNENKRSAKLSDAADSLRDKANEKLNKNRLTNTSRRADIAGNIEKDARKDLFIADTMQNISEAMSSGKAKYLSRIDSKSQVEQLESILKSGHYDHAMESTKAIKNPFDKDRARTRLLDGDITDESVNMAQFPYPSAYLDTIQNIAKKANNPELSLLSYNISKKNKNTSQDEYFKIKFKDEQDIEQLRDFIKKAEKYGGKEFEFNLKAMKSSLQSYDNIKRAGIDSPGELRVALKEYIGYRGSKQNADPIKKMERDLIGKKIDGYFPTPEKIALDMADKLDVKPGQTVLEPSAGKGSLADAVLKKYGSDVKIDTIEVNSTLADLLKIKGYKPIQEDFLKIKDKKYDRIIMNPPFENGQDMDHVRHAYYLLEPGGKMVAIMGEGGFFRSDKKSSDFRDWLEDKNGESKKLPEGSFKTSDNPTGVNTRLVVIKKQKKRESSGFSRHIVTAQFNRPTRTTHREKIKLLPKLVIAGRIWE